MNLLLSEAIMNSQYCRRLIVTHIRKFKRDHKLGQYSEVQQFACVYLKKKQSIVQRCSTSLNDAIWD